MVVDVTNNRPTIQLTIEDNDMSSDIETALDRLSDTVELHSLRIQRDLLTWQVELLHTEVESLRSKCTPETEV